MAIQQEIYVNETCANDNYAKEKRRALAFRILRAIAIVIMFLLLLFIYTVAQVYWYTDRELFWWLMFYTALFALPEIAFIIVLSLLIKRLCVEYDYELTSKGLDIIKVTRGVKRKFIVHITPDNVTCIGKVTSKDYYHQFPQGKKRRPILCACNITNPNIYFVKVSFNNDQQHIEKVIVFEPSKDMIDQLKVLCRNATIASDSKWTTKKESFDSLSNA